MSFCFESWSIYHEPDRESGICRRLWHLILGKSLGYLSNYSILDFYLKVRSISPFCIKLESWLRLTGIPYENIYTSKPSRKGQTPYIEFNGEQIPDSNLSIDFLKDHFKDTIPKV